MKTNRLAPAILFLHAKEPEEIQASDGFRAGLGDELPESVQLFPPGTHAITASSAKGPVEANVVIDEATAKAIADDFERMKAAADKGEGPKPYVDFNHEDREAAGWVMSVYWAGDDLKSGGVRAKVDWSKPGADAITGKAFRQFSPNFRFDRKVSRVVGTGPNMGGLVNRPAFKRIEPLFAKEDSSQPADSKNTSSMKKLLTALAAANLISSPELTEDVAASEFVANLGKLRTDLLEAEQEVTNLQAKAGSDKTELADMKAKVADLQAKVDAANRRTAEATVEVWAKAGRIAPKDEKRKSELVEILAKNPDSAATLEGLLPEAKDPTSPVVKVSAKDGEKPKTDAKAHAFEVKAKEYATEHKVSLDAAFAAVAASDGKLYDDYRATATVRQ
jgi:phage I-like protein